MIPIIMPIYMPSGGVPPPMHEPTWLRDEYGFIRMRWWMSVVIPLTLIIMFGGAYLGASWEERTAQAECQKLHGDHVVYTRGHDFCIAKDGRVLK